MDSRQDSSDTPETVAPSEGDAIAPAPAGEQRGNAFGGELTESEQMAACWEDARINGGIT